MPRGREGAMRLFAAVYPPAEAARAMLGLLDGRELAPHRRVAAEQVHVTVHFIGDVLGRDLEGVKESVRQAASGFGAVTLMPRRLVSLPERGTARLVALELDATAGLAEMHRRLVTRLSRRARGERRGAFLAHATLCRFEHGVNGTRVEEGVEMLGFVVDELRLMRSVLRPGGAEHALVEGVPLTGV